MADHSLMKLGRKAVKRDSRTLRLARYFLPSLPPAPTARDWTAGITAWGMMLNDSLGDCTIAGVGHATQIWTANNGALVTVTDETIEQYYEDWDGYNPTDPSTDQGGVELDVLTQWRKQGFAGHKLTGFADPAYSNLDEVRMAINLFGGVYIGLSLPVTAQTQDVWDLTSLSDPNAAPGSWGGHCVFVAGYDQDGFTCITWGQLKKMTNAFWVNYCDEAHALFSPDWLNSGGQAPSGFDAAQLTADLAAIN